jgi:hypothetical protein
MTAATERGAARIGHIYSAIQNKRASEAQRAGRGRSAQASRAAGRDKRSVERR